MTWPRRRSRRRPYRELGSATRTRHRLSLRDGIAHRGAEAALICGVDVDQTAGGGRDHILDLGHRAEDPRSIDLKAQCAAIDLEGESPTVADPAKATREQ